jgi:hypothetical protein
MAGNLFSLDIVSATWGTVDVTKKVRGLYANFDNLKKSDNTFTITATEEVLGPDPKIHHDPKILVINWRVVLSTGDVSELQGTAIREGETGTINYDGTNLPAFSFAAQNPDKVAILRAFWFNKDVTGVVQKVANDAAPKSTIHIDSEVLQHFGVEDPAHLVFKQISITFAYISPAGNALIFTKTNNDEGVDIRQGPAPPSAHHLGRNLWRCRCDPIHGRPGRSGNSKHRRQSLELP